MSTPRFEWIRLAVYTTINPNLTFIEKVWMMLAPQSPFHSHTVLPSGAQNQMAPTTAVNPAICLGSVANHHTLKMIQRSGMCFFMSLHIYIYLHQFRVSSLFFSLNNLHISTTSTPTRTTFPKVKGDRHDSEVFVIAFITLLCIHVIATICPALV